MINTIDSILLFFFSETLLLVQTRKTSIVLKVITTSYCDVGDGGSCGGGCSGCGR